MNQAVADRVFMLIGETETLKTSLTTCLLAFAAAQRAEEREANLCWEPGHTHVVLMGDGTEETHRLPRVYCPACLDAAIIRARREGPGGAQ